MRSPLYPHGSLVFDLKIKTHQITRYATDEVTISMTKEIIDANQTDPIRTVPSHFQADTSTANITYQYTIIRFTGADQQSINSLASSHKPAPHNNYSVPMSTCTHGYRTFVAELSFIISSSLRVHRYIAHHTPGFIIQ